MLINPFRYGVGGGGAYLVDAAVFDGTNDHMERSGGLTGAADSKLLTFSYWFLPTHHNNGTQVLCGTALNGPVVTTNTRLAATGSGRHAILGYTSGGTLSLDVNHSTRAPDVWYHCMGSFDMNDTGKRHLYVQGVSDLNVNTYLNNTLDFTYADWGFAGAPQGGNRSNGAFADFYFAPGQYIDLSIQANREKFRSATGKPVSLGADGSVPTGVAPLIFFHLDNGEAVANFRLNRGTGGDFAITGTLTTAATSPSD